MKKKVVAVIQELGGAKALYPALARLSERKNLEVRIYAGARAGLWLDKMRFAFEPVEDSLEANYAEQIFDREKPNVLVSAASWATRLEQSFRNEAAAVGVCSITFFDFWLNYAMRFQHASYPITKAPDNLAVIDSTMAHEVYTEGFPKDKIRVLGHPHLAFLREQRATWAGARPKGKPGAAIFFSEDYPENYLRSLGRHPIVVAAEAVSLALEARGIDRAPFHAKPHPSEHRNPYWEEAMQKIRVLPRLELEVLEQPILFPQDFLDYELALGYQSLALFEAAALGLRTVAIPLLKGDRYPSLMSAMKENGVIASRLHPREVFESIAQSEKVSLANPYQGSVERFCNLILE